MFENLTDKLQRVFKNLRGQGKLTDEHLDAALSGIREALLDGDVNVDVADELLVHIRAKALGSEVLLQLSPDQQVLKIVRDELLELLGKQAKPGFRFAAPFGLAAGRVARFGQDHHHGKAWQMAGRPRASAAGRLHRRLSARSPGTTRAGGESRGRELLARRGHEQASRKSPKGPSARLSFPPPT